MTFVANPRPRSKDVLLDPREGRGVTTGGAVVVDVTAEVTVLGGTDIKGELLLLEGRTRVGLGIINGVVISSVDV